eukprot:1982171-Ditylum_brightwellii.AAC.1
MSRVRCTSRTPKSKWPSRNQMEACDEYAAQVLNYMPIQADDGTWTTPFEQVYGIKPDWCNLVPMFSLAYVKRNRDAGGY